jgi:endonuclease YncB( thermonuclease family)
MFTHFALTRLGVLVGAFFFAAISTHAATLYGRVESVEEGDLLTVFNLNRSVKIRLLGLDAPEKDQPLAETSRQHLADLVLGKFVVVHYTGLGQKGYIVGRVVVADMDVCAQMLRDGVAWYDASTASRLDQLEQSTYAAAEQAARAEYRGIWKDPDPVAPWDYAKATSEVAIARTSPAPKQTRDAGSIVTNPPFVLPREFTKSIIETGADWKVITPAGFNFSVLVPGNSTDNGVVIPLIHEGSLDLNIAEGSVAGTAYMVLWAKGPRVVSTGDTQFIETGATQIVKIMNTRLARMGRAEEFVVTYQRDLRIKAMRGKQYKLKVPGLTALMQVFSRHSPTEQELYVLCAVNTTDDDPSVKDFFKSFTFEK